MSSSADHSVRLERSALGDLLHLLRQDGFRVIGPTIRDHAIVYDEIAELSDLPMGITDHQAPGRYRLSERDDDALFGYAVGPHSWKRFLFPPREPLVQVRRRNEAPEWAQADSSGPPMAFVGVRACELHAMAIQDQVFVSGPFVDRPYQTRRNRCLLIAVDCTEPGDLCFCDSMGTGPRVEGDFDLRLTELGSHFIARAKGQRGETLLQRLEHGAATAEDETSAEAAIESCRRNMKRSLDTRDLPERLLGNLHDDRWKEVGERCLSCGGCTLVCPTCFCFNISDDAPLSAEVESRTRTWDSCFTQDHSSIHGAQFRPDTAARYRQWMTHKLSTWTSQFGQSGCVGCGRCIAWCPVGIDLVEEASAIAEGAEERAELPAPRIYPKEERDAMMPVAARVTQVVRETADTVTLHLDAPEGYRCEPGQFNMLALPGIGDIPISVSGQNDSTIEHTIRSVGAASFALTELHAGSWLGLRGPFGSAWPLREARGKEVVVVAGGIGIAPLRGALRMMALQPEDYPEMRLFYGTRSPADIVYDRELLGWMQRPHMRVHVTVDRGTSAWMGNVGVVTKLMRAKRLSADSLCLLCGPEIMMRFALAELAEVGVPDQNIYLSMERNMKCAAGLCGRCQYGPYFICKDGPVFRYDQIAFLFGTPGF